MAQTVEELAELLDGIRLDAERNAENFDKILNTINNKLELISNDTETDDLIKVYLTELKKILEEKHTLMTSEFNKIENSFNTLKSEQESLVKTSDMKEMFEIFTTNMQSVAQELFTQKNLLAQYENNLEKFITDKTDKNDIVNSVTEIKKDVEIINHSFEKSISEINSNIQAIFKNLIVMDPTAQNDIVKRELENIYLSTNAILTGLHTIEQKDDDVLQHFNVLMEKLDNTAKTNDMESLANKTMSIEEKFNTLAQKTDFDNIQNSIEGFAGVLDGLKTLITSSNESHNTTCKQIDKLNSVLSTVVTENDFAGFRHDLADFIQKIIDNSSSLNENLNVNRETLQNLINEVKNYNLTSDFENILKSLNEIKTTAVNNADKIVNEISVVSAKVDSFSTEKVEQKLDSIEETFQDNILIASNSINTLRETSLDNANKIVSEIEKVSTQVGQFSTEPIENKVDLIDEKLSITSQDIKTIQTNIVEKLDNDEKFQAINNSIEFLQETVTSTQTANEASLVEKLLALRDMITSNVNSRDEKFQELHEQINKFVKNINKISSDAEMKLNNSLSEIVDMKLEVEQISKSFAELNFAQENRDSKLVGMISSELGEIGVSIATLQDSVQAGVHQELSKNTEVVEKQVSNLIEIIENLKAELQKDDEPTFDFETTFKEIKDKITAVKQEINLVNTDIIDVLNARSQAILLELAPIKEIVESFSDLDKKLENKLQETNFAQTKEIHEAINEVKDILNNQEEISFDEVIGKISTSAESVKETLSKKITSSTEELKNIISVAMNNDDITWAIDSLKSDISDKVTRIFNERNHYAEILEKTDEISGGNTKISELLDVLNQKVDVLAMTDDENFEVIEEINEVKNLISSQRNLLEKSASAEKANAIETRLEELVAKIDTIGSSNDLKEVRESILATILSVFEQISFIEESEDIKDFVEEKTEEINQNLIEVKQQLKQMATGYDENYSYTLQDVESDIAKLRLVLNELSTTSSKEEISDISNNIHRIVSSVEDLQTSLTQEQISDLKTNFERLSEDVLSISSRTNKLLLTSDESYVALNNGLNDFSNVIYKLEERINYLDNKEITERIEQKLDNTLNVVSESANSDKVMRQALIYMGEWIDTTSENIESLCEQADKIDDIQEILENLQDKVNEQAQLISSMSERFEENQERMDRIEMKLEKILSAIDDIDDTKLTKKVDKIDRQLTKLSNNIEKLTSYDDE